MAARHLRALPLVTSLSLAFSPPAQAMLVQTPGTYSLPAPMPQPNYKTISTCLERAVFSAAPSGSAVTSALDERNPRNDYHGAIANAEDGLVGLVTTVLQADGEDLIALTSIRDVNRDGDTDAPEDTTAVLYLDPLTLEQRFDFVQPGENVPETVSRSIQERVYSAASVLRACVLNIS